MAQDYYYFLGVAPDAPLEEIRKAYLRLAKQYHPDVNPDGAPEFLRIKEVYDTLRDPEKRRQYDAFRVARGARSRTLLRKEVCPWCQGKRTGPWAHQRCPLCDGGGQVLVDVYV